MKLNIILPEWALNLTNSEVLSCVAFDISENCVPCSGYTVITAGYLYILREGKILHKIPLDSIKEIKAEQEIGSGRLIYTGTNGDSKILCRFTQKLFTHFAEFTEAYKYYIKTGRFPEIEIESKVCEKCGHPFARDSGICPRCMKKFTAFLRILPLCKNYWKPITASILITMIIEITHIILPYFQRVMIDGYIEPAVKDTGFSIDLAGFIIWGVCGILTQFLYMVLWEREFKIRNKFALDMTKNLRQDIFRKIQYLSSGTMSKYSSGELINRLQHDAMVLQGFISGHGIEMVIRIFSFIVLAVIMFITNPVLTLIVIMPFPVVYIFVKKIMQRIHRLFHRAWHEFNKSSEVLHDILNGIRVVKSYGSEKREIERYRVYSEKLANALIKGEIFWAKFFPFVSFFIRIGEFIVIYFGAKAVLGETMKIGEFTQYITYVSMMYVPLFWIIYLPRQLTRAGVSASKTFELLDEPDEYAAEKHEEKNISGEVVFDNVSFGYKPYISVLKDISFKIKPGEIIGIVGASGVGKSTLINLIMRLYDAENGKITIDGCEISQIDKNFYKKQLGVVLQETFLFDDSILSNLKYSAPEASFEHVIKAAKIANAHEFISKLPDGYNTRIGDRGYTLSGGERQRIAIARAILHEPKILVLDEATSSLDAETEKLIQDALDKLTKGRTTFAIAHRLSTLRNADRLIVLDNGEVSEIGTHLELMKNKGIYYNLVMAQRQTAKIHK